MWRISADILLLVSVYLLPWWLTVIMLGIFILAFHLYFEGVCAALLVDLLYAPASLLFVVAYRFTLSSVLLLLLAQFVARRFVRIYED